MEESARKGLFAGLAAVAILALIAAAIVWILAVKNAGTWIFTCLAIVIIVIIAEVILIVTSRRKDDGGREPDPHKGPGAEDEILDFVIDADETGTTHR